MTETSPTPTGITHIVADESLSDFFSPSVAYKPFRRAWCYEEWKRHENSHWLAEEANAHPDIQDYHSNLNPDGRDLITHILRYFTQQDVEVSEGYSLYLKHIWLGEARQMMSGYMAREQIHKDAYDYLNTTLGLPETLHTDFLRIDEMRKMHDYLQNVEVGDVYTLLLSIAVFAGFAEGMTLFGSFVMLLSFSRVPEKKLEEWQAAVAEGRTDVEEPKGMMRGMGQIVQWSIRDECYAEGTEVLTERGWVDFKDLTDSDKVAQYDMETGDVSFVIPDRRVEYDVDTSLVSLKTESRVNTLVTKAHGVVVTNLDNGKTDRLTAEEFVPHSRKAFPISGLKKGENKVFSALDRFRIAFCADGFLPDARHTGKHCGYLRVGLRLKRERKIKRMHEILASAGLDYDTVPASRGQTEFRVNAPVGISKELSSFVDLSKVSHEWADQFFDELIHWDGHDRYKDGKTNVFGTIRQSNVDVVQALASLSGRIANVVTSPDPRGYNTYYRVTISKKTHLRTGQVVKTDVPYKGKVRCVTVKTGAVITRYQGCVVVSGNTMHVEGMTRMFREMFEDVKHLIDIPRFKADLRRICTEMVDLELAFIDAAYEIGEVPNLPKEELYRYIHYIADVRMGQLGQEPVYGVSKNPLPWVDSMVHGVEHTNFFENRATEYSRAAMQGDWGDAFS